MGRCFPRLVFVVSRGGCAQLWASSVRVPPGNFLARLPCLHGTSSWAHLGVMCGVAAVLAVLSSRLGTLWDVSVDHGQVPRVMWGLAFP